MRGVNVGGRKVNMSELREFCSHLGLQNVKTFIQSGNIVLDYDGSSKMLEELLEEKISEQFGFEVKVIVRTAAELAKVIDFNPYGDEAYVIFMLSKPSNAPIELINKAKAKGEEFTISGLEIYLNVPKGYGQTKMNNNFFESKLKVDATTRNMRTVKALLEMAPA